MTITVTATSPAGKSVTRAFRDYTPDDRHTTRTATEQADAYEQARRAAGCTTNRQENL
ncbi:hypothetical protein OS125_11390 [Corynebacterium sp. P7003]|uniref:Uncharacterized protein n=1 Tax=Corynebacterium pygosceleis TaxID=2800406 RepID=A0ABT3WX86_9CORY|nr:hypothetical protein [Corynebacterium pygosceleis]MCX7445835.1 hypothetical protein [Corynebacterium pygosceleis]